MSESAGPRAPVISALMAVYDAERFVAETIESVLGQTFRDFEFLIADDGSRDRSLAILRSYATRDSRIQLSGGPNRGVSLTRNELIRKSRGEFLAVVDADDVSHPERFERQLQFLRSNPAVVCVGAAHDLIDEKGRFLTTLSLPLTNEEIQRMALAGHGSICHPCAMLRRSAVVETGGYDPAYPSAHDLDLWLKLGELGDLANLSESLLQYRLHTRSVSGRNFLEQRKEARQACEAAWKRRGVRGSFEAEEPWRPGPDRRSRQRLSIQYGWWAFNSGQRRTAIVYGLRAVGLLPFDREGWRLLVCSLYKRLPEARRLPE